MENLFNQFRDWHTIRAKTLGHHLQYSSNHKTLMTNTLVEVGVEYFLPTDAKHWIPNGFQMVELNVDEALLSDDRDGALDEAAEKWCEENGFTFSRVIESDEW